MGDRETLNKIFAIMRNLLIVPMDGLNPIPRKGTTKRECYRALWEIQELLGVRRIGCKHIAQTNADAIRAMSDKEMMEYMYHNCHCPPELDELPSCPYRKKNRVQTKDCRTCWLDWLKQEVDSDPT